MSNTQMYELNRNDAVAHFLSVISSDGENFLSRASEKISDGRFFVFAPPGAEYHRLKQLTLGGIIPPGVTKEGARGERIVAVENLADKAAGLIHQLASGLVSATAFIREPYLKPGDNGEILRSLVTIDSSLYKVVSLENCDVLTLTSEITRFQVSWSFLLILSSVDSEERDMSAILANASAIIVNAYDGESYLCWIRPLAFDGA